MTRQYTVWGYNPRVLPEPYPIRLTGGNLQTCRAEQRERDEQGWRTRIYAPWHKPLGLRDQMIAESEDPEATRARLAELSQDDALSWLGQDLPDLPRQRTGGGERAMSKFDGPGLHGSDVAYIARCGDDLSGVSDAELDAGIDAAEQWVVNAERAHQSADARAYRQIVGILWREYRIRKGWQAQCSGTGRRNWHVMRETPTGYEGHVTTDGRTVWFGSYDAARARAAKLNGQPVPERVGC